jgi:hypothetical protein
MVAYSWEKCGRKSTKFNPSTPPSSTPAHPQHLVISLVDFLNSQGIKSNKSDYGYDFPALGLNTYNHVWPANNAPVECLGVALIVPEASEAITG